MAVRLALGLLTVLLLSSCSPNLPEPESPAAQLYANRCSGGCHRVYEPRTLKFAMWKMQVERMQGEMVRRGMPPLNAEESRLILDYLQRHAG